MYSTCLFCQSALGRNEALEAFPVGRRLAYDAARGRLWVVCRRCERWNLTPLEERWEAIEQAERLYRGTRLRSATDQVGLARLADGTELVRIGRPLRPELAAWRYGDQFGRRRVRQAAIAGAGFMVLGGLVIGGVTAGVGMAGFAGVFSSVAQRLISGNPESVVARIPVPGSAVAVRIRRVDLARVRLVPTDGNGWALEMRDADRPRRTGKDRFDHAARRWEGDQARDVLARLLPAANRYGASRQGVRTAVDRLVAAGDAETFLTRFVRDRAAVTRTATRSTESWWGKDEVARTGLMALAADDRLALEMAVHEESERRAMEGELAALERAWREAEEIAAIADDLLLPRGVTERLADLRGRRGAHGAGPSG